MGKKSRRRGGGDKKVAVRTACTAVPSPPQMRDVDQFQPQMHDLDQHAPFSVILCPSLCHKKEDEIHFKIQNSTLVKRVLDTYCRRTVYETCSRAFLFKGIKLSSEEIGGTAGDLGLVEGDVIQCVPESELFRVVVGCGPPSDFNVMGFMIEKSTLVKQVFDAYCRQKGYDPRAAAFTFKGTVLSSDEIEGTAGDLGLVWGSAFRYIPKDGCNGPKRAGQSELQVLSRILDMHLAHDGWNGPKRTWKDLQVLSGSLDMHAWCEDEEGIICDYTDSELAAQSDFGSSKIIRLPFDGFLQVKCESWCKENRGKAASDMIFSKLPHQFEAGFCYERALSVQHHNPKKKFTIIYVSLGFEQSDGRIFWEYG